MFERLRPARGRSRRSDRLANDTPQFCLDSTDPVSKIRRIRQTELGSGAAQYSRLGSAPSATLAAFKSATSQSRRSVKYDRADLARSKIGLWGHLAKIRARSIPVTTPLNSGRGAA